MYVKKKKKSYVCKKKKIIMHFRKINIVNIITYVYEKLLLMYVKNRIYYFSNIHRPIIKKILYINLTYFCAY